MAGVFLNGPFELLQFGLAVVIAPLIAGHWGNKAVELARGSGLPDSVTNTATGGHSSSTTSTIAAATSIASFGGSVISNTPEDVSDFISKLTDSRPGGTVITVTLEDVSSSIANVTSSGDVTSPVSEKILSVVGKVVSPFVGSQTGGGVPASPPTTTPEIPTTSGATTPTTTSIATTSTTLTTTCTQPFSAPLLGEYVMDDIRALCMYGRASLLMTCDFFSWLFAGCFGWLWNGSLVRKVQDLTKITSAYVPDLSIGLANIPSIILYSIDKVLNSILNPFLNNQYLNKDAMCGLCANFTWLSLGAIFIGIAAMVSERWAGASQQNLVIRTLRYGLVVFLWGLLVNSNATFFRNVGVTIIYLGLVALLNWSIPNGAFKASFRWLQDTLEDSWVDIRVPYLNYWKPVPSLVFILFLAVAMIWIRIIVCIPGELSQSEDVQFYTHSGLWDLLPLALLVGLRLHPYFALLNVPLLGCAMLVSGYTVPFVGNWTKSPNVQYYTDSWFWYLAPVLVPVLYRSSRVGSLRLFLHGCAGITALCYLISLATSRTWDVGWAGAIGSASSIIGSSWSIENSSLSTTASLIKPRQWIMSLTDVAGLAFSIINSYWSSATGYPNVIRSAILVGICISAYLFYQNLRSRDLPAAWLPTLVLAYEFQPWFTAPALRIPVIALFSRRIDIHWPFSANTSKSMIYSIGVGLCWLILFGPDLGTFLASRSAWNASLSELVRLGITKGLPVVSLLFYFTFVHSYELGIAALKYATWIIVLYGLGTLGYFYGIPYIADILHHIPGLGPIILTIFYWVLQLEFWIIIDRYDAQLFGSSILVLRIYFMYHEGKLDINTYADVAAYFLGGLYTAWRFSDYRHEIQKASSGTPIYNPFYRISQSTIVQRPWHWAIDRLSWFHELAVLVEGIAFIDIPEYFSLAVWFYKTAYNCIRGLKGLVLLYVVFEAGMRVYVQYVYDYSRVFGLVRAWSREYKTTNPPVDTPIKESALIPYTAAVWTFLLASLKIFLKAVGYTPILGVVVGLLTIAYGYRHTIQNGMLTVLSWIWRQFKLMLQWLWVRFMGFIARFADLNGQGGGPGPGDGGPQGGGAPYCGYLGGAPPSGHFPPGNGDPAGGNAGVVPPPSGHTPVVNPPVVNPRVANPPFVNPPFVNPPVVNPPVVNPPVVNPPVVNPPVANPLLGGTPRGGAPLIFDPEKQKPPPASKNNGSTGPSNPAPPSRTRPLPAISPLPKQTSELTEEKLARRKEEWEDEERVRKQLEANERRRRSNPEGYAKEQTLKELDKIHDKREHSKRKGVGMDVQLNKWGGFGAAPEKEEKDPGEEELRKKQKDEERKRREEGKKKRIEERERKRREEGKKKRIEERERKRREEGKKKRIEERERKKKDAEERRMQKQQEEEEKERKEKEELAAHQHAEQEQEEKEREEQEAKDEAEADLQKKKEMEEAEGKTVEEAERMAAEEATQAAKNDLAAAKPNHHPTPPAPQGSALGRSRAAAGCGRDNSSSSSDSGGGGSSPLSYVPSDPDYSGISDPMAGPGYNSNVPGGMVPSGSERQEPVSTLDGGRVEGIETGQTEGDDMEISEAGPAFSQTQNNDQQGSFMEGIEEHNLTQDLGNGTQGTTTPAPVDPGNENEMEGVEEQGRSQGFGNGAQERKKPAPLVLNLPAPTGLSIGNDMDGVGNIQLTPANVVQQPSQAPTSIPNSLFTFSKPSPLGASKPASAFGSGTTTPNTLNFGGQSTTPQFSPSTNKDGLNPADMGKLKEDLLSKFNSQPGEPGTPKISYVFSNMENPFAFSNATPFAHGNATLTSPGYSNPHSLGHTQGQNHPNGSTGFQQGWSWPKIAPLGQGRAPKFDPSKWRKSLDEAMIKGNKKSVQSTSKTARSNPATSSPSYLNFGRPRKGPSYYPTTDGRDADGNSVPVFKSPDGSVVSGSIGDIAPPPSRFNTPTNASGLRPETDPTENSKLDDDVDPDVARDIMDGLGKGWGGDDDDDENSNTR
ncbi:hypothetical protein BCR34DRAFT_178231 [Clohesyomyces aquaticus]|uniref:Uncharacterized protein n=1 Tax=Clohesyomyces aquaticus TaxID=1231657 RepID=A0A1Y1ZZ03_9PLEO|nr:hypothetical protein BCR34DRAFT_178231 [Clohesyomyces aquaticus]